MAKRFIETGIFRKGLVRGLKAPYKAFLIYYITECDHAGVWSTSNLDIDSILMGEELTEEGIKDAFKDKLIFINDKVFMPGFVEYQYGHELNPDNRVHKSVIARLRSIGIDETTLLPIKPLISPSRGVKDMDKYIVIDKDKDIPSLGEFCSHLIQKLPTLNPAWSKTRAQRAATSRYETYIEDGWKDGHGKPIKNWKTKSVNAIKHEKPWLYGDDLATSQPVIDLEAEGPTGWQDAHLNLYGSHPSVWALVEPEIKTEIKEQLKIKA